MSKEFLRTLGGQVSKIAARLGFPRAPQYADIETPPGGQPPNAEDNTHPHRALIDPADPQMFAMTTRLLERLVKDQMNNVPKDPHSILSELSSPKGLHSDGNTFNDKFLNIIRHNVDIIWKMSSGTTRIELDALMARTNLQQHNRHYRPFTKNEVIEAIANHFGIAIPQEHEPISSPIHPESVSPLPDPVISSEAEAERIVSDDSGASQREESDNRQAEDVTNRSQERDNFPIVYFDPESWIVQGNGELPKHIRGKALRVAFTMLAEDDRWGTPVNTGLINHAIRQETRTTAKYPFGSVAQELRKILQDPSAIVVQGKRENTTACLRRKVVPMRIDEKTRRSSRRNTFTRSPAPTDHLGSDDYHDKTNTQTERDLLPIVYFDPENWIIQEEGKPPRHIEEIPARIAFQTMTEDDRWGTPVKRKLINGNIRRASGTNMENPVGFAAKHLREIFEDPSVIHFYGKKTNTTMCLQRRVVFRELGSQGQEHIPSSVHNQARTIFESPNPSTLQGGMTEETPRLLDGYVPTREPITEMPRHAAVDTPEIFNIHHDKNPLSRISQDSWDQVANIIINHIELNALEGMTCDPLDIIQTTLPYEARSTAIMNNLRNNLRLRDEIIRRIAEAVQRHWNALSSGEDIDEEERERREITLGRIIEHFDLPQEEK